MVPSSPISHKPFAETSERTFAMSAPSISRNIPSFNEPSDRRANVGMLEETVEDAYWP